jgi:ATP-dependent DNA helicase RecG
MHLPININDLLNSTVVESDRLEFKSGWNPEPIMHTICAFANDFHNFGGGYIVIGMEENKGKPIYPPLGIDVAHVDKMQKDILNVCSRLKPAYTPIISLEKFQDKDIFIIWVPGGHARPYTAPVTLGKSSNHKYYIRKLSSTVIAKNDELKELIGLTATVPFDDRINHFAALEDIKLPLIQSFLKEIESDLLQESRTMPLVDLCRQMALIDGGNEFIRPRNIALLFFNDQPEKFFPYIQIDVVHFPDDEGGDIINEAIFKGPLDHQLRSALRHIKNNYIAERILKIPGQAEASRFFNYPYEAIEEALVNAVYHRSYEIRDPIEVRINRTSINVVSHPGPDPSIKDVDIEAGKLVSRRYRNRRIGEFLKELEFTEGRGTGVPKIRRSLKNNGSPDPIFHTDGVRQSFWTEIKIHPEFLKEPEVTQQVARHVGRQVNRHVAVQVIGYCMVPRKASEIRALIGLKDRESFQNNYLRPLIDEQLITLTIPDKPQSRLQQYVITDKGKAWLTETIDA